MMLLEDLLNEAFSRDMKDWVKSEYPDAKIKGNKILLSMCQDDYNKNLLKILRNFDFHAPENERHVGKDWGATYEDGHAVVSLE